MSVREGRSECVCVCERERECVCVSACAVVRECMSVCVCVRVSECVCCERVWSVCVVCSVVVLFLCMFPSKHTQAQENVATDCCGAWLLFSVMEQSTEALQEHFLSLIYASRLEDLGISQTPMQFERTNKLSIVRCLCCVCRVPGPRTCTQ